MLSQWTAARIAVGRVGASLPTQPLLDFTMDHARARDAIHTPMNVDKLTQQFQQAGFLTLTATSQARNRSEYLRRPDLGRSLNPESVEDLTEQNPPKNGRLTVVVADGLSAQAPETHALPLLLQLREAMTGWQLDSIVFATQARVDLGDDIGALRGAEAVLILIGERPGLKSPDSLGAYLTYHPRPGRMDSERNCVSNIRTEGLPYDLASYKLLRLLCGARQLGASGVLLKDDSDDTCAPVLPNKERSLP